MNLASITLDVKSVQECVHNIEQFTGTKTVILIAYYKHPHIKYGALYGILPSVLSNIVIEYMCHDIEIICTDNKSQIINTVLHINIISDDDTLQFSSVRSITRHPYDKYELKWMQSFLCYYLTEFYKMTFEFDDKSVNPFSYPLSHNYVIERMDLVSFENELLVFKTLYDEIIKNENNML